MRLKGGFTLLEAVLASALFLLLLGLLFSLVAPMMRASRQGSEMSDLRQMAALTLETMAREIEQSGAPGLKVYDNGTVLSVHPVQGITAAGASVWSSRVSLFFWKQSARQIRKLSVGAPQARPYLWQPADLTAALAGSSTFLCGEVADFRMEGFSPQGLRPPILLRLQLQRDRQLFRLEQSVLPGLRNLH